MTAEIAILNKTAVALAADSAVTIQGPEGGKIFDTANKLFALSKHRPVGLLIYGNSQFMGVPWEVIIKEFRASLGTRSYQTLPEYADAFMEYLTDNERYFPPTSQERFVSYVAHSVFHSVTKAVDEQVHELLDAGRGVTESQVRELLRDAVEGQLESNEQFDYLSGADAKLETRLGRKYATTIREAREQVVGRYPTDRSLTAKLNRLVRTTLARQLSLNNYSGLVVAGYGTEEFMPRLVEYKLDGVVDGRPLSRLDNSVQITLDNEAAIVPFAQSEMVHLFMEGIEPDYSDLLDALFRKSLNEVIEMTLSEVSELPDDDRAKAARTVRKRVRELANRLSGAGRDYRMDQHVRPIIGSVAYLPVNELAEVAESLVNLTSFKRRVALGQHETVGGAIDVAVISKGDGFIWINRKHYFKAELNPGFFATYYQR